MSVEHKRSLYAFLTVAIVCGVIVVNAIRSDAVIGRLRTETSRIVAGATIAHDSAYDALHAVTSSETRAVVGGAAPSTTSGGRAGAVPRREASRAAAHVVDTHVVAVQADAQAPDHASGPRVRHAPRHGGTHGDHAIGAIGVIGHRSGHGAKAHGHEKTAGDVLLGRGHRVDGLRAFLAHARRAPEAGTWPHHLARPHGRADRGPGRHARHDKPRQHGTGHRHGAQHH